MKNTLKKFGVSMLVMSQVVIFAPSLALAAAPNWTLNAPSAIDFSCGSINSHTLNTVSEDTNGNLTGTGSWNPDPSYTWNLTGAISGDNINFTITYTGTQAGSVYNSVGTIAPDGSISGSTDSNCTAFSIPVGSATKIVIPNEPPATCPVNTTQTFLETVDVPANLATNTLSTNTLANGSTYLLKESGVANAGDGIDFDARYSFRTPTSTTWTDSVSTYESYGPQLLDLLFNGSTPWGNYNTNHEYTYLATGNGVQASFLVNDVYYPNNTGSLKVDIYSCTPVVTPPVCEDNKDHKDGEHGQSIVNTHNHHEDCKKEHKDDKKDDGKDKKDKKDRGGKGKDN